MAVREVRVFEVREVLRLWLAGDDLGAYRNQLAALGRASQSGCVPDPVQPHGAPTVARTVGTRTRQ